MLPILGALCHAPPAPDLLILQLALRGVLGPRAAGLHDRSTHSQHEETKVGEEGEAAVYCEHHGAHMHVDGTCSIQLYSCNRLAGISREIWHRLDVMDLTNMRGVSSSNS